MSQIYQRPEHRTKLTQVFDVFRLQDLEEARILACAAPCQLAPRLRLGWQSVEK
jgi:hypothetical protein